MTLFIYRANDKLLALVTVFMQEKFSVMASLSFLLAHDGVNSLFALLGVNCTACEYSSEALTLNTQ